MNPLKWCVPHGPLVCTSLRRMLLIIGLCGLFLAGNQPGAAAVEAEKPKLEAEEEAERDLPTEPQNRPALKELSGPPQTDQEREEALVFWSEVIGPPTPQHLYFLRVDLTNPILEVVAMPSQDPDGEGPAEATLVEPLTLARQHEALAAVNANGYGALNPEKGGVVPNDFPLNAPSDICGVVVHRGKVVSPPNASRQNDLCFWLDDKTRPGIGVFPADGTVVREACNAFWIDLVESGRILPQPGGDRHPRTALGIDATGRWLLLVVVDGRQPDVSIGMTAEELAQVMLRQGCSRAFNLDGGGSSVMMITPALSKDLRIVNTPSTTNFLFRSVTRPVPLLIGVRLRTPKASR